MTALHLFPELEDALRRIPGVRKARVVTDGEGRPTEIHLITDTRKSPQYFVRDVQAVAMTHYDLDIDHRIVSIVQMDADAADVGDPTPAVDAEEAEAAAPRPALTSISVKRQSGGGTEVSVALTIGSMVLTGEAAGPSAPVHRARLVAEATLGALTELLGIPAQIESSQIVDAGAREVAVSVLTLEIPRLGEQVLCGSALVRGDEEDAVARSVLAAVNRRLSG
jgi:hypothetical protein